MIVDYEMVIGLETHVQLKTASKLFSGCPAGSGGVPNSRTDAVVLGLPGVLPTLNEAVVESALKMGKALSCEIRTRSTFSRKQYFYPDLPKGYQITQDDEPICEHGYLDYEVESMPKRVRVQRIHLEEDAGKTIHDAGRGESRIDFNRAGTPLIEIVTQPDLRSPEEVVAYLKELHKIVLYLEISDGDMEAGNFRFDANLSLRPRGQEQLGTKTELKNMNSFKNVQKALEAEADRQLTLLLAGKEVIQETRNWNEETGKTESMRSKENAPDYRYMPDPDLPVLILDPAWVESVASSMPELPAARKKRFLKEYGLSEYDASILTESLASACYFEAVLKGTSSEPKIAANWLVSELFGLLAKRGESIAESPVTAQQLGQLLDLLVDGKINGKMGKVILEKVHAGEGSPANIVEKMGTQVTDPGAIRSWVVEVLESAPEQVALYRAGKEKVIGFLMGQVMKKSRGKANPALTTRILTEELKRT